MNLIQVFEYDKLVVGRVDDFDFKIVDMAIDSQILCINYENATNAT